MTINHQTDIRGEDHNGVHFHEIKAGLWKPASVHGLARKYYAVGNVEYKHIIQDTEKRTKKVIRTMLLDMNTKQTEEINKKGEKTA